MLRTTQSTTAALLSEDGPRAAVRNFLLAPDNLSQQDKFWRIGLPYLVEQHRQQEIKQLAQHHEVGGDDSFGITQNVVATVCSGLQLVDGFDCLGALFEGRMTENMQRMSELQVAISRLDEGNAERKALWKRVEQMDAVVTGFDGDPEDKRKLEEDLEVLNKEFQDMDASNPERVSMNEELSHLSLEVNILMNGLSEFVEQQRERGDAKRAVSKNRSVRAGPKPSKAKDRSSSTLATTISKHRSVRAGPKPPKARSHSSSMLATTIPSGTHPRLPFFGLPDMIVDDAQFGTNQCPVQ